MALNAGIRQMDLGHSFTRAALNYSRLKKYLLSNTLLKPQIKTYSLIIIQKKKRLKVNLHVSQ